MAPEILADENLGEYPESGEEIIPQDIELTVYLQTKKRLNESLAARETLGLSFEELKAADVYAFGLVLWEIFLRCITDDGRLRTRILPIIYHCFQILNRIISFVCPGSLPCIHNLPYCHL